jgi:RimJ/RimL family protein N-acetyltransferase
MMLTTERLTLVPHHPDHFDAYAEFWRKDPGPFLRHLAPMNQADAWTRLLRHFGHWAAFGYGPFLGFDQAGRLIVEAGYLDFRRGVGSRFDGVPEGMWKIDLAVAGQGYATEALAAITNWFDAQAIAPRSVCMIDPGNEPSIRVANRLGFREFDRIDYRDTPVVLFERMTRGVS